MSKEVVFLEGVEIQYPPFSRAGCLDAGARLRDLQEGAKLSEPVSRPLPQAAPRVHEIRLHDAEARKHWRIIYRIDPDFIVVVLIYDKDTNRMPKRIADLIKRRLTAYDAL